MKEIITPTWIKDLPSIVEKCQCRSDVLRQLGLSTNGSGNHRVVKRWIEKLNLSTSHFDYRKILSERNGNRKRQEAYKPEDFLVEKWMGSIGPVKRWARENLKYECEICGNNGTHRGLPLSLQLDHINGNPLDNRIENFRWLCPNCHTQCKTYGGKGLHLHRKKKSEINPTWNTDPRPHRRKVVRPTKEVLEKEILMYPAEQLGKKYGVTGNNVKKWCRYYEIPFPNFGRGYWSKKNRKVADKKCSSLQNCIR